MHGEKIITNKAHRKISDNLIKILIPEILQSSDKYVIAISGESGSGKTVIAHSFKNQLEKIGIKTLLIQQDDYFRHPPQENSQLRRRDLSIVGTQEVKLNLLNKHIKDFKDPKTISIRKPIINFKKDEISNEALKCKNSKVLIVEGTYTAILKNTDVKLFMARTFRETLKGRIKRKREKIDKINTQILTIEHKIVSRHKIFADLVVEKNKTITNLLAKNRKIKRICMMTIHGYVGPHPTLGKTDTGGQVTYVLELSKAIAEKGIKVDIYTRKFRHRKSIEHVNKNIRIIRIPCGGNDFIPKEKLFPYLNTFAYNMKKFIEKEKIRYDIYHSHYWDAGYSAMKLTESLNYFFVHTFHSLGAWKKEQMGGHPNEMEKLYRFKERIKNEKLIFSKVRSILMTSSDMVRICKDFYKYTSKKYIVLPAGVNTNFFRPLKPGEKEKKIDVPQNFIFWVGRFDANKGLDSLLKAFADIVTKSKDLFLVIGGGSKQPQPKEKKLIKDLNKIVEKNQIKNRVFFTHYIPDNLMPSYYRKAKFFVLPSRFEPFGMTAAEAIACGTPVIVSHKSGVRKFITHGHDGLIVNCANKKDLSQAYELLNKNIKLNKKLSKNGLKIAREQFSWTCIADNLISHYKKLIRTFPE